MDKDGQTTWTGPQDTNGNDIIIDADGDSKWEHGTDDVLTLILAGGQVVTFTVDGQTIAGKLSVGGNSLFGSTSGTAEAISHVRSDSAGDPDHVVVHNRSGSGSPISSVKFVTGPRDLSDDRYASIESSGGSTPNLEFKTANAGSPETAMTLAADKTATFSGKLVSEGFFSLGNTSSEVTISSGAFTATKSTHYVDTESDAATDDLDTISGGGDGILLFLRPVSDARTIVCKDGTGNLLLNGDFSMDSSHDYILLLNTGSFWQEISRSNNAS